MADWTAHSELIDCRGLDSRDDRMHPCVRASAQTKEDPLGLTGKGPISWRSRREVDRPGFQRQTVAYEPTYISISLISSLVFL